MYGQPDIELVFLVAIPGPSKEPVSYMFVFCRVKWPARSFNL